MSTTNDESGATPVGESKKQTHNPTIRKGARSSNAASKRIAQEAELQDLKNQLQAEKAKSDAAARDKAKLRAKLAVAAADKDAHADRAKALEEKLVAVAKAKGNTSILAPAEVKTSSGSSSTSKTDAAEEKIAQLTAALAQSAAQVATQAAHASDLEAKLALSLATVPPAPTKFGPGSLVSGAEHTKAGTDAAMDKLIESNRALTAQAKALAAQAAHDTTVEQQLHDTMAALKKAELSLAQQKAAVSTLPVTVLVPSMAPATTPPPAPQTGLTPLTVHDLRLVEALGVVGLTSDVLRDKTFSDVESLHKQVSTALAFLGERYLNGMLVWRPTDTNDVVAAKAVLVRLLQPLVDFDVGEQTAATPKKVVAAAETKESKEPKVEGLGAQAISELRRSSDSISIQYGLSDEGRCFLLRLLGRLYEAGGKVKGATKDDAEEKVHFLYKKVFDILQREQTKGSAIFGPASLDTMSAQLDAGTLRRHPLLEAMLVIPELTFGRLLEARKPKQLKGLAEDPDGLTKALSNFMVATETAVDKRRRQERHQSVMFEWFISAYKVLHSDEVGRYLGRSFDILQEQARMRLRVDAGAYDEIMAGMTAMLTYFLTVVVKIIHPIVQKVTSGVDQRMQLQRALLLLEWDGVHLVESIRVINDTHPGVGSVDFGVTSATTVAEWLRRHSLATVVTEVKLSMAESIAAEINHAVQLALGGGSVVPGAQSASTPPALGPSNGFTWDEAQTHQAMKPAFANLPFCPDTDGDGAAVSIRENGVVKTLKFCACHMASLATPTTGPLTGKTALFTCKVSPIPGKKVHMLSRVPYRGAGTVMVNGTSTPCTVIGCQTAKGKVFAHSYA
jgi:hypothetical protein